MFFHSVQLTCSIAHGAGARARRSPRISAALSSTGASQNWVRSSAECSGSGPAIQWREVEQVHALVDQLAAAGARRVGAPLAVVAEAAAVPVAAAQVHQLAVLARADLAAARAEARVEAVVEADLDEPSGRPLRARSGALDLGRHRARPASRPARARPPASACSAEPRELVVRRSPRPRRRARARAAPRASRHARPPCSAASAAAASASTSKQPTSSSLGPERLRALGADQPAADDRRRAAASLTRTRSRTAPPNSKSNGELRRPCGRHRLARVLRVAGA